MTTGKTPSSLRPVIDRPCHPMPFFLWLRVSFNVHYVVGIPLFLFFACVADIARRHHHRIYLLCRESIVGVGMLRGDSPL